MRLLLPLLLPSCVLTAMFAAEQPKAPATGSATPGSTNTVIFCDGGTYWVSTNAVWHKNVRVLDPQMYLECELLNIYSLTNRPAQTNSATGTNAFGRIDTVVAETNLLIMMRDITIIGDKAVYTASNDVAVITGDIVVLETDKAYLFCTNLVFNRRTGIISAEGFSELSTKEGVSLFGTNAPPDKAGTGRRIGAPPTEPKAPRHKP